MVDGDLVLAIVKNPVVIGGADDLEQAAFIGSILLCRERKRKAKDQFAVSAVGEKANSPRLVLPRSAQRHTSEVPGNGRTCIGRGGGNATKGGAESHQEGFDGLLR